MNFDNENEPLDDFETLQCEFVRPILSANVFEAFQEFGVNRIEITGNTVDALWDNIYLTIENYMNQAIENEINIHNEDMQDRIEFLMMNGRMREDRKLPRKFNDDNVGLASRRHQDVGAKVCANIGHFFNGQGLAIDTLPNTYFHDWTSLSRSLFDDFVRRCVESGRFPAEGVDVALAHREKGCGRGIPIPIKKKVFFCMVKL